MVRENAECIRRQLDLPGDGRGAMENLRRLEKAFQDSMAPDIPSYDVDSVQSPDFDEWIYTEGLNCFMAFTQSVEVNARILDEASRWDGPRRVPYAENLAKSIGDKWSGLREPGLIPEDVRVFFAPGGNLFHAVNWDNVLRSICTDARWMIKPHPITQDDALRELKLRHGVTRILDKSWSGMQILRRASHAGYVTSSEMGIVAMLLGKPVTDFTLFEREQAGRYSGFYLALEKSEEAPGTVLDRIMSCPWSGIVPLSLETREASERFLEYKEKTLEIRRACKPMVRPLPLLKNRLSQGF